MKVLFLGSPIEVLPIVTALLESGQLIGVVSQPAKPVGRGGKLEDPPVAAWAKSVGVRCLQPVSSKSQDFLEELRLLSPDVAVTAAYGQILSQDFLSIPRRATINIHPSKLPSYRGAIPIPQALLNGDAKTAVTILFTVKKLDAGSIIIQKDFDIGSDEKAGELTKRLFMEGSALLNSAFELIRNPLFVGTPQDETKVTHCRKIEKDDGQIDWMQSAVTSFNQFRAFDPWPGVWTIFSGNRIVISSMKLSVIDQPLKPGDVFFYKPTRSLIVGTSKGQVSIDRLKPAGSKEMDAASFWNGIKNKDQVKFGQ